MNSGSYCRWVQQFIGGKTFFRWGTFPPSNPTQVGASYRAHPIDRKCSLTTAHRLNLCSVEITTRTAQTRRKDNIPYLIDTTVSMPPFHTCATDSLTNGEDFSLDVGVVVVEAAAKEDNNSFLLPVCPVIMDNNGRYRSCRRSVFHQSFTFIKLHHWRLRLKLITTSTRS